MSAPKVWMASSTCSVEGCSESGGGIFSGGRCAFHEAFTAARNLPPESFDRLRAKLATTPPLTDEERRARQVRAALGAVEWTARDLNRAKKRARDAGATDGQIADVVRKGKASP